MIAPKRSPYIYLSGGMTKFGSEEFNKANAWRIEAENLLQRMCPSTRCFNPNDLFNFKDEIDATVNAKQIMEIDLYYLSKSTHVLVNFNDPGSLGTMAELAIAYRSNIPIIGIAEEPDKLHPWQRNMCSAIKKNVWDACTYMHEYYLALLYN